MFTYNSVPTTCTASLITGFSLYRYYGDEDGINSVNDYLEHINVLTKNGYKTDFAILHAFLTEDQYANPRVKTLLEKCGFKEVFLGKKDRGDSRHKETGDLHLFATDPATFKEGIEAWKKELLERRAYLNRPKVADPARLKFPELKLFNLRKAGLVHNNTRVDDRISSALCESVSHEVFYAHIRMVYGFDLKKYKINIDQCTTLILKERHEEWRNEKCIYA